jgi:hypothetical protein
VSLTDETFHRSRGREELSIDRRDRSISPWVLRAGTPAGAWVSHDGVRWRLGRRRSGSGAPRMACEGGCRRRGGGAVSEERRRSASASRSMASVAVELGFPPAAELHDALATPAPWRATRDLRLGHPRGANPASAAAMTPPSPRSGSQLRRPVMQRRGGRGRFQIGFPIFDLIG